MRSRPLAVALPLLLLTCAASVHAAGPYYARGDYYAGTAGTWNVDAGNQLHDDGLHGDGAAGDGVYAGDVTSDQPAGVHGFKVANADWSENWPNDIYRPYENARVWTSGPGDVVHFRLDTNAGTGWSPSIGVATDHDAPVGTTFELIGGDPELGGWTGPGVPLTVTGSVLSAEVTLAAAGTHSFRFAAQGDWHVCMFGVLYNMDNVSPDVGVFTSPATVAGSHVGFVFDRATGQARVILPVVVEPIDYYARGDFYAGSGATWGADAGNQLHDDGLHGDGAAGDGVYGATIVSDQPPGAHEWKIANADWSRNWPLNPDDPLANARLFTTQAGEAIHFRLDLHDPGDGWQPGVGAVACDHAIPAGSAMTVFAGAAGGGPLTGENAVFDGTVWRADQVVANAGAQVWLLNAHSADTSLLIGPLYNMSNGRFFTFSTPAPDVHVHFEWDPATGRGRALLYDPTPVRHGSWGALKRLYR